MQNSAAQKRHSCSEFLEVCCGMTHPPLSSYLQSTVHTRQHYLLDPECQLLHTLCI